MARPQKERQDDPMPSPPRRRTRLFARILVPAALLLAGGALLGFGPVDLLTSGFFRPMERRAPDPDPGEWPHEVLWLEARDGSRLEAWLFPSRDSAPAAGLVLQAHGNAGNLSMQWRLSAGLADHGFDVLVFDYRGFGRSEGETSRRAAREDLEVALAEARRLAAGRPLFVLGQSIGASLSLEVLADPEQRRGVAALAVDGPFDSWPGIASLHLVGRGALQRPARGLFAALLRRSGLEPIEAAGRLDGIPILIVAGGGDRICPPEMQQAIHEAAGPLSSCLELPDEPHVGLRGEERRAEVLAATAAFFHDVL